MHLHLYLGECINNFGPIYAFGLFSFEIYNTLFKNLDINQKRGFEITMMKRFLKKIYAGNYIQSFEEKFSASTVNFLYSITRSQLWDVNLCHQICCHSRLSCKLSSANSITSVYINIVRTCTTVTIFFVITQIAVLSSRYPLLINSIFLVLTFKSFLMKRKTYQKTFNH
ncbi:hypothetical protein PHYBLDRAFT_164141 [Phycomyces blakesleeanus NRRL 1555(-)]|uniref:Uncharacterized protein n=1 Tax=Phycomyces blakesleeanus (strain ATCC 8743b / DSM 1359 / FGSC 10004 / NBRC 33097 / NRRL 1555) TaxID=763407 RepID=A0A167Q4I7_PHYB8|nr:hypothetical protein PHYBLDRAFT_164141 [Phycomyces blakesleeanus NRRL 1555(-)]OAD79059.1 hypothetical protein PHYBLDRAFT_164141 [Phycomyces blakesleeanus NRRL 1555(-)]|eukprot:XP_018297099.1 hypothetical protein PHYBLDRAFT_164141 [Phycomyces blakesleeanus NRRL 1555(-)]